MKYPSLFFIARQQELRLIVNWHEYKKEFNQDFVTLEAQRIQALNKQFGASIIYIPYKIIDNLQEWERTEWEIIGNYYDIQSAINALNINEFDELFPFDGSFFDE